MVDDVDNKDFLTVLFNSMYDELPAPKPKIRNNPLEVVGGKYENRSYSIKFVSE